MHSSVRIVTDGDFGQSPHMTMTVGEFCEILRHAVDCDRTWLQDFERDEIWVSRDLFVVLQTYWNINRAA